MLTLDDGAGLYDLTLDGNKTANASIVATFSTLVYVTGRGTRIASCNFFQVPSTCVLTPASADGDTGSDLFIDNCYIKNTNKYCFVFRSNRCQVSNCTFFGTGINDGHAIRYGIYNVDNIAYPGCKVEGGSVTGCTFKYVNSGSCLFEWNAYNITFTGNTSSYTYGVKCEFATGEEAHNIVITGNYFEYGRFTPLYYDEVTETATQGTTPANRNAIAGFNCMFANNTFYEMQGVTLGNGSVASANLFNCCGSTTSGSIINTLENGNKSYIVANTIVPRSTDNPESIIEMYAGTAISNNMTGVAGQTIYGLQVQYNDNVIMNNFINTAQTAYRAVSTTIDSYFTNNTVANISGTETSIGSTSDTLVIYNPGMADLFKPSKTIASGVITLNGKYSRLMLETEGSAATDDLDTINGGFIGQVLTLSQTSSLRDVTVKNGTGNITLSGGDYNIQSSSHTITLMYNGSTWDEVARTA